MIEKIEGTKFDMGQVVLTPGVLELVYSGLNFAELLQRHGQGDWGDLTEFDKRQNDEGLNPETVDRLFSSYDTPAGKIWIITEWDRSVTTGLLPSEY